MKFNTLFGNHRIAIIVLVWALNLGLQHVHGDEYPIERAWSYQLGTNKLDHSTDVASDYWGNVYMVGRTKGSLSRHTNAGGSDAFLVSFDDKGKYRWTHQWGTALDETAQCVATDRRGNVYVVSNIIVPTSRRSKLLAFNREGVKLWESPLREHPREASFGTGLFVNRIDQIAVVGTNFSAGERYFITTFDRCGNRGYFRPYDANGTLDATAIGSDCCGNTYIAGSMGSTHPSLTKHDAHGVREWSRQLKWEGKAHDLVVDRSGCVTIVGWVFPPNMTTANSGNFNRWLDGLLTGDTYQKMPDGARSWIFVARYSPSGNLLFNERWENVAGVHAGFAADADYFGTTYITGFARNAPGEIFVSKVGDTGKPAWIHYVTGPDPRGSGVGIDVDLWGRLNISGRTPGQIGKMPRKGSNDGFVIQFERNDYPLSPRW